MELGNFLKSAKVYAKRIVGIEIEKKCLENLKKNKIDFYSNLDECEEKFDLITMFHCFEHLPRPLEFLIKIKSFLKENGKIIIEVPHARDFLLKNLKCKDF